MMCLGAAESIKEEEKWKVGSSSAKGRRDVEVKERACGLQKN